MTMVVVVVNSKGGSCKSTTCAALAATSAREGFHTLVIELDMQQTSTMLARGEVKSDEETAPVLFRNKPPLPTDICQHTPWDYDLIPGGAHLKTAEYSVAAEQGHLNLRKALRRDPKIDNYDLVLIDTSANKTQLLNAALLAATHVIIPFVPSEGNKHDLVSLIELLDEVQGRRAELNQPPFETLGIVFCRVTIRRRSEKSVIESVRKELSGDSRYPVADIHIPDSSVVGDAEDIHAPVTVYRPTSPAATAYQQVFNDLFAGRLNRQRQAMHA